MVHAEVGEIVGDAGGVVEAEAGVQLDPVGRPRAHRRLSTGPWARRAQPWWCRSGPGRGTRPTPPDARAARSAGAALGHEVGDGVVDLVPRLLELDLAETPGRSPFVSVPATRSGWSTPSVSTWTSRRSSGSNSAGRAGGRACHKAPNEPALKVSMTIGWM
jgi:hypothetical protein